MTPTHPGNPGLPVTHQLQLPLYPSASGLHPGQKPLRLSLVLALLTIWFRPWWLTSHLSNSRRVLRMHSRWSARRSPQARSPHMAGPRRGSSRQIPTQQPLLLLTAAGMVLEGSQAQPLKCLLKQLLRQLLKQLLRQLLRQLLTTKVAAWSQRLLVQQADVM